MTIAASGRANSEQAALLAQRQERRQRKQGNQPAPVPAVAGGSNQTEGQRGAAQVHQGIVVDGRSDEGGHGLEAQPGSHREL